MSDKITSLNNAGGAAVINDSWSVISYQFPPTNYQSAPQPTEDTEDGAGGAATAISMTADERVAMVPAQGELIWDTTIGMLFVGDGTTPGGIVLEGGSGGDFTSVTFWKSPTV